MSATITRQGTNGSIDMTGWCRDCRAHAHKLCDQGDCACVLGAHPKRTGAESPEDPLADVRVRAAGSRKPVTTATPTRTKLTEPVWELVRADPPAPPPKPRKLTAVDHARPFVERLMAEGDREWHRFALFPSSMAAGQTRTRIAKAYREFEFKAVRVPEISQSALYGRWTGKAQRGQL